MTTPDVYVVAAERAIAAPGIRELLELVNTDPPGLVIRCAGCGVATLVFAAHDNWTGKSMLHAWDARHRGCGPQAARRDAQ